MPQISRAFGVEDAITGLAAYINLITASLVKLMAYISEVGLIMSLNIVDSPVVQQGFKIALTLANLGFVIAIIVIALATIFRNQTYGVKRALIRLVVMAILVNFSLILTGMVLNFTDRLTLYFVSASSPEEGFGGSLNFSNRIMNAVNPAILQDGPPQTANAADAAFAAGFGAILASAVNALALLAFAVLAATLFIRYAILSILLIAMPLAWLSWIFPSTSSWWKKWWDKFIQWSFYAPAMMFFVYLAMSLAQSTTINPLLDATQNSDIANALGKNLVKSQVLVAVSKQITILFILFGGFFAAKSMGVGMAGSASNLAQSASKKIWGATKRGAGRGARRMGGTLFGNTLKKSGEQLQGVGANGNWLTRTLTAPVRGIGAQMTRGKEALTSGTFKQYQEKYKNMNEDERINRVAATRGIEQIALLESLKDSKKFSRAISKAGGNLAEKDVFERWGQGELYKNARTLSGLAFKQAHEDRALGKRTEEQIEKDLIGSIKGLDGEKLAGLLSPFDEKSKLLDMNESELKKTQTEIVRSILMGANPSKIQNFLEKANPDQVENLKRIARELKLDKKKVNGQTMKWLGSTKAQGLIDENDLGITEESAEKLAESIQAS